MRPTCAQIVHCHLLALLHWRQATGSPFLYGWTVHHHRGHDWFCMAGYKYYVPFVGSLGLTLSLFLRNKYTNKYTLNLERANYTGRQFNGTIWLDHGKVDDWLAYVLSSDTVVKNILRFLFVPLCGDLRGQHKTTPDRKRGKFKNKLLATRQFTSPLQSALIMCHMQGLQDR